MRSSNSFVAIVAGAVWLWLFPSAAGATVATVISANTAQNGTSLLSITTTGAVAPFARLWVGGMYSGIPVIPTLTGCTMTATSGTVSSTGRTLAGFTCLAGAGGIASGTVISQIQSGTTQGMILALTMPATVSTYDTGGGNTASGVTMSFGFTPANTSSYALSLLFTVSNATYTEDPAWTYLTDIFDSAVSNTDVLFQERVLTTTAPITSTVTISPSGLWLNSYDVWLNGAGGGGGVTKRSLTGVGK